MVKRYQIISGVCAAVFLLALCVMVLPGVFKSKGTIATLPDTQGSVADSMEFDSEVLYYLSDNSIAVDGSWASKLLVNTIGYNWSDISDIKETFITKSSDDEIVLANNDDVRFGRIDLNKNELSLYKETPTPMSYNYGVGLGSTYDECVEVLGTPSVDLYSEEKKVYYESEDKILTIEFGRAEESYNIVKLYTSTKQ